MRGSAMGRKRRKHERFTRGGFVPLEGDGGEPGTPTFELDGRQVAEFFPHKHSLFTAAVGGLIERDAWMMLIPPHEGNDLWGLFVEIEHVPYVERRLKEVDGLYLTRGPHCPSDDEERQTEEVTGGAQPPPPEPVSGGSSPGARGRRGKR
jgi:hypothetical protein